MYVAFDPGKRTGVATFNEDGSDRMTPTSYAENNFFLALKIIRESTVPIKTFIVEDFRLQKDKAFDLVGQEMHADRTIGSIEFVAWELNVPIVFQSSSILPTALKWAGIQKPRGHLPDHLSAYAHGIHYLIKNGIRRHRILDEE